MRRPATGLMAVAALLLAWPGASRADVGKGKIAFQRCYACHSVEAGEHNLQGPNLLGVLGRRAGTLQGFEFSPAMTEAGAKRRLVWTRKTLDAFLADPQLFVPGTNMSMPPLPGPADRRAVIDYLEQAAKASRGGSPSP